MRDTRAAERLAALFVLGVLLFSPLMLRVFDAGAERSVFGIPVLFLYLFAAWAILIGLMALAVERPADSGTPVDAASSPKADE